MNMRLVDAGLAIIAFITGLANYEGLSKVVGHDWWAKAFCAIIAVGVMSFTFLIWHGAFAVAAPLPGLRHRARGWATTLLGCVFLLAISSWWSISAIGGDEAVRYGYEKTVVDAEKRYAAGAGGAVFEGLKSDLSSLAGTITALVECERLRGCISGTPGDRGVAATLSILATSVVAQSNALTDAERRFTSRRDEGKTCLKKLRYAVSPNASATDRTQQVAAGVECLNGVMADLTAQDVTSRIGQTMARLTEGTIIPVTVKTDRQKQAVEQALVSIKEKASAVAKAALATPEISFTPISLPTQNAMIAVVQHWEAVIPAWATAIALDLLPLILLMFQSTIMASRRSHPEDAVMSWPVRDLMAARSVLGGNFFSRPEPPPIIDLEAEIVPARNGSFH